MSTPRRRRAWSGGTMGPCFASSASVRVSGGGRPHASVFCLRPPAGVCAGGRRAAVMSAAPEKPPPPQRPTPPPPPRPLGIRLETNGDVLKAGAGLVVLGFGVKYGIQALGAPDLLAGQITTGVLSVASLLAWISTYVFRVGTKSMTYAQQLKEYEDAVIEKRYQELTPEELTALSEELEDDL